MLGLYGLTAEEVSLALAHPYLMYNAYGASKAAVEQCGLLFIFNENNDESDACRHFIWAALLIGVTDKNMAEKILDSHEADVLQSTDELMMDQKNNKLGLQTGVRLKSNDSLNAGKIVKEFLTAFEKKKISVLKPSLKNRRKK